MGMRLLSLILGHVLFLFIDPKKKKKSMNMKGENAMVLIWRKVHMPWSLVYTYNLLIRVRWL